MQLHVLHHLMHSTDLYLKLHITTNVCEHSFTSEYMSAASLIRVVSIILAESNTRIKKIIVVEIDNLYFLRIIV